jgi:hypothetical protein
MRRAKILYSFTDVSQKSSASFFKVQGYDKKLAELLMIGTVRSSQNDGDLLPDYMAAKPRK